MLKQSLCVFGDGGECAGWATRSRFRAAFTSDEVCHTLLLGAVTLEEEMRTHLGKGDTSIDHHILSPPTTQGGLFPPKVEILSQSDLQCTADTVSLSALICRERLLGDGAGCVWR